VEIVKKKIKDLIPADWNPRLDLKEGDPQYEKLKRSIDEFDMVEPIVWNEKTGHVIGGHQRLKILKAQGKKEVEVSVVRLSEKKEKALNLALNKIVGDWDYAKLPSVLEALDDEDRLVTGFDADEIAVLLKGASIEPPDLADLALDEDVAASAESYVVYVTFSTREKANDWLKRLDLTERMKETARTMIHTGPGLSMQIKCPGCGTESKIDIPAILPIGGLMAICKVCDTQFQIRQGQVAS